MADDDAPKKTNKKRGLPPLSPRTTTEENDTEVRPVRRKPKKKVQEKTASNGHTSPSPEAEGGTEAGDKPTPRRRRKRSPSQGKDGAGDDKPTTESTTATPKKKKRKPRADSAGPDKDQSAEAGDVAQPKDGQGSKTSLISKEGETPRKKGGKKKKKGKKTVADSDDYGDAPWAEDLRTMKEDIITGEEQEEEVEEEELGKTGKEKKKNVTSFIAAPILQSQPLDKIFIETSSKFKGQSKSALSRQLAEETVPVEVKDTKRSTTIDFALATHKIFRVISLFLHGLTAGLALWQMVTVFELSKFSSDDFLEHYHNVSMPLQASYYFLLVLCTVSACDRFDIGSPSRRFVLRALTLQNGTVSIVIYIVALVLSLVAIRYDDRMYLAKVYEDLYANENVKTEDIDAFKSINAARSVLIILAWLVLSITPNSDRLGKNLKSGETGLERELELDKVSAA